MVKLTQIDKENIYALREEQSAAELAKTYNVSSTAIYNVIKQMKLKYEGEDGTGTTAAETVVVAPEAPQEPSLNPEVEPYVPLQFRVELKPPPPLTPPPESVSVQKPTPHHIFSTPLHIFQSRAYVGLNFSFNTNELFSREDRVRITGLIYEYYFRSNAFAELVDKYNKFIRIIKNFHESASEFKTHINIILGDNTGEKSSTIHAVIDGRYPIIYKCKMFVEI